MTSEVFVYVMLPGETSFVTAGRFVHDTDRNGMPFGRFVYTSMGGARPKAVVEDANALWVAKFNCVDDPWNNARVEHAMLMLARECGLATADSRITSISRGGLHEDCPGLHL